MVRRRARRDNHDGGRRAAKARLAEALLRWYDANRRDLPWRAKLGETPDPYAVWLSEIMLQQTTVATVAPYYRRFLALWPDVSSLAAAGLDDVLREWQGLGYYARARNLHACARTVSETLGGRFPGTEHALRPSRHRPYTAAAVAAIAFGRPQSPWTAMDGSWPALRRGRALPGAKDVLRELAAGLVPQKRAGDYAQAAMDLGATVCTPRAPSCPACPWRGPCAARASGRTEELPRRAAKPVRPLRQGVAFFLTRKDGAIWLRRRPEKGLLGGMMELPTTPWRAQAWRDRQALPLAPAKTSWRPVPGRIAHGFTHFRLELRVLSGRLEGRGPKGGRWLRPGSLGDAALPTVMKKVVRHALAGAEPKGKARPERVPGGRDIVRGGIV
jgi:A/G-specific adenine glycosylase